MPTQIEKMDPKQSMLAREEWRKAMLARGEWGKTTKHCRSCINYMYDAYFIAIGTCALELYYHRCHGSLERSHPRIRMPFESACPFYHEMENTDASE